MFVGERSYGRSNSRTALLKSWEARLEEAENGRPFAFRPMYRRSPHPDQRTASRPRSENGTQPIALVGECPTQEPAIHSAAERASTPAPRFSRLKRGRLAPCASRNPSSNPAVAIRPAADQRSVWDESRGL